MYVRIMFFSFHSSALFVVCPFVQFLFVFVCLLSLLYFSLYIASDYVSLAFTKFYCFRSRESVLFCFFPSSVALFFPRCLHPMLLFVYFLCSARWDECVMKRFDI